MELAPWQAYVSTLEIDAVFVTVSGAHLYGFPSADSDIDLRGCHRLPLQQVVGLNQPSETVEVESKQDGIEVDLVSHDIGKYLRLLVKNNRYVLEQIFSPLIVIGHECLEELRPIAENCITRNHYFHYRGFYRRQRDCIEKQQAITAKALLYAYRVLLTGIHLLQTGQIQSNLLTLNQTFQLSGIDELVAQKVTEKQKATIDWNEHSRQLDELEYQLDVACERSHLPEQPEKTAVNQLLLNWRLSG